MTGGEDFRLLAAIESGAIAREICELSHLASVVVAIAVDIGNFGRCLVCAHRNCAISASHCVNRHVGVAGYEACFVVACEDGVIIGPCMDNIALSA